MENDILIAQKIKQRRLQLIVHSYLYYDENENIVSDSKWGKWAFELVNLQKEYPDISKQTEYYELFKDFDGSSGYYLYQNLTSEKKEWVERKARELMKNVLDYTK